MVKVYGLNSPFNAWGAKKPYMVVRVVGGDAWFYDAWDDYLKAMNQAIEVNGMVVPRNEVAIG